QLLVAAADLAARADDAAGEGQDHARHPADRRDRRFGSRPRLGLGGADDQEVAAGHALDRAEDGLADELAVHHRHPPVATAFRLFRELPAIAEEAQVATDPDRLVAHDRQAIVTSRRRAGENALADAVDDRLLQGVAAEGEQQQADAGPAVGGLV